MQSGRGGNSAKQMVARLAAQLKPGTSLSEVGLVYVKSLYPLGAKDTSLASGILGSRPPQCWSQFFYMLVTYQKH